jgi:hypothetical protein
LSVSDAFIFELNNLYFDTKYVINNLYFVIINVLFNPYFVTNQ